MPALHPFSRLGATAVLLLAALLSTKWPQLLALYVCVLAGIAASGLLARHLRFVLATVPLLAALVVIWAWAAPAPGHSGTGGGVLKAAVLWSRICVLGGALQWFLVPLIDKPLFLRSFTRTLRLPSWVGLLLIAPLSFLPEVGRRIHAIVDARKAQGLPASGVGALRALPSMIGPLLASLLDTALVRAELWTHRDLLSVGRGQVLAEHRFAFPDLVVFALASADAALASCI